VIAKCATNPIIVAGTSEQCIDLFDRGLGAAESELEHPLHRRREFFLQLPLDRTTIEFLQPRYGWPLIPIVVSAILARRRGQRSAKHHRR
jgi:hypothetical protein